MRSSRGARVRPGDPVDRGAAFGAGLIRADLAGAGGFDGEPELLLERARDRAPNRMALPTGDLGDLLDCGALGTLEQLDHPRLLGAGARRGLLGRRSLGGPRLALGRLAFL